MHWNLSLNMDTFIGVLFVEVLLLWEMIILSKVERFHCSWDMYVCVCITYSGASTVLGKGRVAYLSSIVRILPSLPIDSSQFQHHHLIIEKNQNRKMKRIIRRHVRT